MLLFFLHFFSFSCSFLLSLFLSYLTRPFLYTSTRAFHVSTQVNFVADGSRTQHGSFTAGLCLDSLIGAPAQDTRHRGGSSTGMRHGINV